ncbi:MAG TPA: flippase-like domain-containing protein [Stellaceae bacterium]|nr:flippase-like domain-containing protein [Stellaceae bacterium]
MPDDGGVTLALRLLGLAFGAGVVAWLVAHADSEALLAAFAHVGWGFLAILAARAATVVIDAGAWSLLLPRGERPRFAVIVPLRWIGEAINTTLPVAQVGGDVVRARLLQRRLPLPARGAATVAVDFALSLFAQILFTALGLVLLAWFGERSGWWWAAAAAAMAVLFALLCRELLARRRLLRLAQRWAARVGRDRLGARLQAFDGALGLIAQSRAVLLTALCLHIASFLAHAAEVWLTLYLMAAATGFAQAVLLESLSLTARSAAFLIPSGWGAQEATLVALAAVAGLSPDTALALGLIKRAREFAIGVPGLCAWGIAERRPVSRQPAANVTIDLG